MYITLKKNLCVTFCQKAIRVIQLFCVKFMVCHAKCSSSQGICIKSSQRINYHRIVCSRTLFIKQASKLLVKNNDKSGKVYYTVHSDVHKLM